MRMWPERKFVALPSLILIINQKLSCTSRDADGGFVWKRTRLRERNILCKPQQFIYFAFGRTSKMEDRKYFQSKAGIILCFALKAQLTPAPLFLIFRFSI